MNQSFYNSPEFKRASSNAADTGLKLIFKWLGILVVGTANAIKAALMSIVGK